MGPRGTESVGGVTERGQPEADPQAGAAGSRRGCHPPRPTQAGRRAWRPSMVGHFQGRERGWGAGRMLHPPIRWAKGYVAKLKRMVHLRKETVSAPSQTHQANPPQIQGESVKSQSQWEAVTPLSESDQSRRK